VLDFYCFHKSNSFPLYIHILCNFCYIPYIKIIHYQSIDYGRDSASLIDIDVSENYEFYKMCKDYYNVNKFDKYNHIIYNILILHHKNLIYKDIYYIIYLNYLYSKKYHNLCIFNSLIDYKLNKNINK